MREINFSTCHSSEGWNPRTVRGKWIPAFAGMTRRISLCLVLLSFLVLAHAESVDRYPLPSVAQQQQFHQLITQLRCLVCQNQDLADSNADLAKDLRQQVYTMVLANKTDAQIKQYLTARYGNFILFKPPFAAQTAVLWLMPFFLLAIGGVILWRLTHRRKAAI